MRFYKYFLLFKKGNNLFNFFSESTNLSVGDLIFWLKSNSSTQFDEAVCKSGGDAASVFHVSLVHSPNPLSVIHATASPKGVLKESFADAYKRLSERPDDPNLILRFFTVNQESNIKERAVKVAETKIGCPYNDVFSENCLDSKDKESYYCCQLVRKCYSSVTGKEIFPLRPLNFGSSDGTINPYWVEYFAKLNRPVPDQEFGSHPSDFITSSIVTEIEGVAVDELLSKV